MRGFSIAAAVGPAWDKVGIVSNRYSTTSDGFTPGYVRLDGAGKFQVIDEATNRRPDPIGGNIMITGGPELLFPLPFIKDQRSVRTSVFVDTGQVYSTNCSASQVNCYGVDLSKLVVSTGFGLTWITGFGPLTFSIAKPLKESDYDRTEFFQFSLGTGF